MASEAAANVRESFDSLPQWAKLGIAAVALAPVVYKAYKLYTKRPTPYKADWKPGMVYLYQFQRTRCVPSLSPYCLKLESWLRIYEIDYENVDVPWGVMSREGMMPFVELDGVEYPDSALAMRALTDKTGKGKEETQLSADQRLVARATECMVENRTFWSYAQVRYLEKLEELLAKAAPPSWNTLFFTLWFTLFKRGMKAAIRARLYHNGIGRHERADIIQFGVEDIRALSEMLSAKNFFLGSKPTRVDCAVFSILSQIWYVPIDSEHKQFIKDYCENLVDWMDRFKQRVWPDWDKLTTFPESAK